MGAVKNWCYEWIQKHLEENDNGTVTAFFDDTDIRMHFPSLEAAETYMWEHKAEQAFSDALAHEMDVEKNRRKYGDL